VTFDRRSEPGIDDDPSLMLLLRKTPADLSLFELRRAIAYLQDENPARCRRYKVEYERKRAGPLGVLIVMALAIPFAITGVRVNPAVNISKSVGLFFAYFLLSRLATLMGSFGTVDAVVAAWLPDAAMVAAACWFFLRLR
jgi:lipopolysaccharide export system permease protein